jgi:hypothetical protein
VSSTTFFYWNFARKIIVHSTNLTFHETEFPQRTEFPDEPDEAFIRPPADETNRTMLTNLTMNLTMRYQLYRLHHLVKANVKSLQSSTMRLSSKSPARHRLSNMFGPLADSTPKSFTDAINRPDGKQWWDALCAEITVVIQNKTWDLVDLPPGKRAIPLK